MGRVWVSLRIIRVSVRGRVRASVSVRASVRAVWVNVRVES